MCQSAKRIASLVGKIIHVSMGLALGPISEVHDQGAVCSAAEEVCLV